MEAGKGFIKEYEDTHRISEFRKPGLEAVWPEISQNHTAEMAWRRPQSPTNGLRKAACYVDLHRCWELGTSPKNPVIWLLESDSSTATIARSDPAWCLLFLSHQLLISSLGRATDKWSPGCSWKGGWNNRNLASIEGGRFVSWRVPQPNWMCITHAF
jgi:hypothetical protein